MDSPKGLPLFAEVQRGEAVVVLPVEHPVASPLQQSPTHLHASMLCSHVESRRPLLVNSVHCTSLATQAPRMDTTG